MSNHSKYQLGISFNVTAITPSYFYLSTHTCGSPILLKIASWIIRLIRAQDGAVKLSACPCDSRMPSSPESVQTYFIDFVELHAIPNWSYQQKKKRLCSFVALSCPSERRSGCIRNKPHTHNVVKHLIANNSDLRMARSSKTKIQSNVRPPCEKYVSPRVCCVCPTCRPAKSWIYGSGNNYIIRCFFVPAKSILHIISWELRSWASVYSPNRNHRTRGATIIEQGRPN